MKIEKDKIELRYSNWVSMLVDMIKPKNLYLVGGRGVAKTTDIIAKRSIDIIHDMPRGTFGFISDTYVNAMTNIIPSLLQGWERQSFLEGYHYVIDKEPPDNWERPYVKTIVYKHTISTWNGCKFLIKSLDRPSANAGVSTVHLFGDETKYLKMGKLKKALPTLRGDYILYKHSPFFMGQTFLTDMPDVMDGEDDWILQMQDGMDVKQVFDILQVSFIINEIEIELLELKDSKASEKKIANTIRKLDRWKDRFVKIRRDSTFFYVVSSLVNIDVLTFEYFVTQMSSMSYEEFKKSILSLKPSLAKGQRFYGSFGEKHLYEDGYNYDYYDSQSIKDVKYKWNGLRYINETKGLEVGVDFGNMISMVVGQTASDGKLVRLLKNFYELPPHWMREIADIFLDYFDGYMRKSLLLYYDRAGNNYNRSRKDLATQLKNDIETDRTGKRTGWRVQLMSVGQGNISHEDEYNLCLQLMGESNPRLPRLLIDKYECKELVSSIKGAKLTKNSRGQLVKDKRSEKIKDLNRLPMESTNMSDAFKYFICRKEWINIAKSKNDVSRVL